MENKDQILRSIFNSKSLNLLRSLYSVLTPDMSRVDEEKVDELILVHLKIYTLLWESERITSLDEYGKLALINVPNEVPVKTQRVFATTFFDATKQLVVERSESGMKVNEYLDERLGGKGSVEILSDLGNVHIKSELRRVNL